MTYVLLSMGGAHTAEFQPTLTHHQVFVMDSEAFPFFKGETYHQFHNDMTEDYGRKYNNLRKQYVDEGTMAETGCPEKFL